MTDLLDDLLGPSERPGEGSGAPTRCCQAEPVRACTSCERPTCRTHLWTMLGVCDTCAAQERFVRFQRRPVPEAHNWLEGGA